MIGKLYCPCNCGLMFKPNFRSLLLDLEREAGFELNITSGPRCDKYNATVTPNVNSAHTLGLAADIAAPDSHTRYKLIRAIYARGIKRVGRNDKSKFIHIDIATGPVPHPREGLTDFPQEVDWPY